MVVLLQTCSEATVEFDYNVTAATAWLRNTEAFQNRSGRDNKIQKTFNTMPKFMRQLTPLMLVMQTAALQQEFCQDLPKMYA